MTVSRMTGMPAHLVKELSVFTTVYLCFCLQGYDTHTGLAKAVGKFHQEDCAVVKVG